MLLARTGSRLLGPACYTPTHRWYTAISDSTQAEPKQSNDGAPKLPPRVEKEADVDGSDVERTTGIIERTATEGLIYFDHVYPPWGRVSSSMVRRFGSLFALPKEDLLDRLIEHAVPPELPIDILRIIPREKDGGAFIRYKLLSDELTQAEAETAIAAHLKNHPLRLWFDFPHHVRVFGVQGSPWIEDLRRFVTNRVRVTFEGPDLSQETIYSMMRRYGPINDIIPPPPGFKDTPRSTLVLFSRFYDAATARNCVTGQTVDGTTVHISFEPLAHKNAIKQFFVDHPRITLPIVLALLAGLAVLIFDPIRVFFMHAKISGSMLLDNYPVVAQLRRAWHSAHRTFDSYMGLNLKDDNGKSTSHLWDERIKSVQILRQWVDEGVGTFIVVAGPRGAGKEQLVMDHALRNRDKVLQIDCEALVPARSDNAFIKSASHQLGYYPVFPWMNSIVGFVDLAVQSLTGQKTGMAQDLPTQLRSMLSTSVTAVQAAALEHSNKKVDDDSDESYLQLHPEEKPVIVIRNFLTRPDSQRSWVYSQLAEWAAQLIASNTAHVIFITSDVTYEKVLSSALSNQVFKELFVGDATLDASRTFIKRQCSRGTTVTNAAEDEKNENATREIDLTGLDDALVPLGGRMTDLQALARRLKSGESPQQALSDMIEQSAIEILQMFLMRSSSDWTREQVWTLTKALAALPSGTEELPLAELSLDPNFKSRDQQQALHSLEHSEMITTHTIGGRIVSIKAGKPLYHSAFKMLVEEKALYATMESELISKSRAGEEANIKKCEEELSLLAGLPKRWETNARVDYLAQKVYASQMAVKKYDEQLAYHKKVLKAVAHESMVDLARYRH